MYILSILPLDEKFLLKLKDNYIKYKMFRDTGIYEGEAFFSVESLFEKLFTIELHEHLHHKIQKNKGNN